MELKIWRIHPQGITIIPAEKTLAGTANPSGVKFCGPFTNANKYGFWVLPPVDIDLIWRNSGEIEHKVLSEWNDTEIPIVKNLLKSEDPETFKEFTDSFGGRVKIDCGRVEPNIVQIWTGVMLQTSPGWGLLVRSPINMNMDAPYRIQEGIIETDWLKYDIWINVAIQRKEEIVKLRRNMCFAQFVPVPRQAYDENWNISQEMINRNSQEAEESYKGWVNYNYDKWIKKNKKDSATYIKTRKMFFKKKTI